MWVCLSGQTIRQDLQDDNWRGRWMLMCVLSCSVARVRWLPWECYGHYDGGAGGGLGAQLQWKLMLAANAPQDMWASSDNNIFFLAFSAFWVKSLVCYNWPFMMEYCVFLQNRVSLSLTSEGFTTLPDRDPKPLLCPKIFLKSILVLINPFYAQGWQWWRNWQQLRGEQEPEKAAPAGNWAGPEADVEKI